MPVLDDEALFLQQVERLVSIQKELVECFVKTQASAKDWKFLSDVPPRGQVVCVDEEWAFVRHGTGVEFTNKNGLVVDIHRCFRTHPNAIDAHRLSVFLKTARLERRQLDALCEICERRLDALCHQGRLSKVEAVNRLYTLVT